MTVLSRNTLPDCGSCIGLYELDRPLEVASSVYRQVDRSRLFMELPLEIFEGIASLVGPPTPFYQFGDCQFVVEPAPASEPVLSDDDEAELFGPDGQFCAIPIPPPPDGALSDLAAGFERWRDALRDVDPSDAYACLGFVYPEPAPSGAEIKEDLIETVSWLADRARQVIDRNGVIAISGI